MDEQGYGEYLNSGREVNGFKLQMQIAKNGEEVAELLEWYCLSEADFIKGFPDLAERVLKLPSGTHSLG
ncbi:hypothetical protein [Streptomyces sp. NPDC054834]